MNKGPGQLDQPFVERIIRSLIVGQPQLFQYIMGFVKQATVEAFKVTEVVRVQFTPSTALNQGGNLRA